VIAAMSGGVDSAVAAGLLAESGYDVVGVTMKMYAPTRPASARSCCGIDDFDDARASATVLNIPHYVLDFEETFQRNVIDRFVDEYARGRTPNPCVSCNNFVKLGTLARYAQQLNATFVATGHYARIEHRDDGPHLFRNPFEKDQAYALAQLAPAQLAQLLLPLGTLSKATTRAHARRLGLPVHDKTESQDICFVEGGDYRDVLDRLRPDIDQPGDFVNASGARVGTHVGVARYTVGQRAALASNGNKLASNGSALGEKVDGAAHIDGARYVTRIDASTNTIIVGREDELYSGALIADEVNLIRPDRFHVIPSAASAEREWSRGTDEIQCDETRVFAMIRYRSAPALAYASLREDGTLNLRFEHPQRAIAPGQLVALFDEHDEVLGAATIKVAL